MQNTITYMKHKIQVKRYYIFGTLALVSVGIIVGYWSGILPLNSDSKIDDNLFLSKEFLSRSAILVNADMELGFFDVSKDIHFNLGDSIYDSSVPIYPGTGIAVVPDQSAVYIGAGDKLIEFHHTGKLKRSIPISNFNLGKGEFFFIGRALASNKRLWLSVSEVLVGADGSRSHRNFVIQWDFTSLPETRLIGPKCNFGTRWDVDRANQRLFIPGPKTIIYDFSTLEMTKKDWGSYYWADFDEEHGLLLSSVLNKPTVPIIRVDLKSNRVTEIISEGTHAMWGNAGAIYYCTKNAELWRFTEDVGCSELLYEPSSKVAKSEPIIPMIKLSEDRTFLAYIYRHRQKGSLFIKTLSCVTLDLSNKEVREISQIRTAAVGWIVGVTNTIEN